MIIYGKIKKKSKTSNVEDQERILRSEQNITIIRQNIIADRHDTDRLRSAVNTKCMSGLLERETHGTTVTSKYKEALLKAEEK